jgi:hypothetical protein
MQVLDSTGVSSSWVNAFYLVAPDQLTPDDALNQASLAVEYNSGTVCHYPDTTKDDYYQAIAAGSPGEWVHRNIYSLFYRRISL